MAARVDEIAEGIFRICTHRPDGLSKGLDLGGRTVRFVALPARYHNLVLSVILTTTGWWTR
ncbi:MAG: hypothetical protein ACRDRA_07905 [Pseudonocardiaceae bacterium]